MKVLHITPRYEPAWEWGGVVRSVSQICRGLARRGVKVTVYTTISGNSGQTPVPVNQPVDVGGVEVWYFRTDWLHKFAYSRALGEAVRRTVGNFDLVVFSTFWCYPGIPAGRAARRKGIPYIMFPQGSLSDYALSHKAYKKRLYLALVEGANLRHAAALRFTGEMERERTAPLRLRVPSFIVPNSVLAETFQNLPERATAREKLKLPGEARILLYVGRLVWGKGLEMLLQAFAALRSPGGQEMLILAGPDGGLEQRLRHLATGLGIADRVWFTGYVTPEQRNILFRAADLLVLLSLGENFGNVVAEAMWTGLPVLISDQVGLCREVATSGAGVVVPLDLEVVIATLRELLSDRGRLAALGQKAQATARDRFDNDKVCRLMATAYEDVLSGRRSPGLGWSDAS